MTDLHRPIKRRTNNTIRDGGKSRRLVVTLYPGGVLGLRPEKTRREELVSVESVWSLAVKQRIAQARAEKRKARTR